MSKPSPRKFAEDTTVSAAKSKAEVERLLAAWGAHEYRWTNNIQLRMVHLEFTWNSGSRLFHVRFGFTVQDDPTAHTLAQQEKWLAQRERSLYRLLCLHIKGILNAVDAGLVTDVEALLPYMVAPNGETYGQMAVKQSAKLGTDESLLFLPGPTG